MSFLAPFMLWGAVAAGIPVVLHFFFRSRYRKVPWAAMKFLLTSVEQTSRRLRFQELLLLLVRVAVLALLALALARPSTSAGPGGSGEAVDAVLVLDTSYSMDARAGSQTRLEQAKAAARSVVDHLPPHSTVQVVACSDRATLLGPRAPANLDQARRLIDGLEVNHLATDFLPGVTEAASALQRGHAPNKELYLFSDMQTLGWEQQAAALTRKLQDVHRQATVNLVRCGTRPPHNAAVVGIVPQSGIPHTGERAGFAVLVRNGGKQPLRNLSVSLAVDGRPDRETQPVGELGPGETRAIPLTARLDHAGLRVLTATIKPDELEADNRFDQVLHVRDQVRVLVVDGSPNERDPEKAGSFFLMHGLLPVRDEDKAAYHVQPRLVTPRQATPELLDGSDLCILVNVALEVDGRRRAENLSRPFLDNLAAFVRRGHGLIVFGGDHVSAGPYNAMLHDQHGLLPLKLAAHPAAVGEEHPWRLDRNSADSALFALFRNDEYYKGINGIEIRGALEVEEPARSAGTAERAGAGDPTHVDLRYDNGGPAIISRRVGAGEVMLVTTSADLSWTDWPLWRGMFVPFVDMSLNHLLQGPTQHHNRTAGQPLVWHPAEKDAARNFVLVQPNGGRVRLGPAETVHGRPVVSAGDTLRAGVYHLAFADASADEGPGPTFAVVPDPRESEDLESPSDGQLDERLGFRPVHLTAGGDMSGFSGTERLNREWALWILAAVVGLALGESALAWLCGRAR